MWKCSHIAVDLSSFRALNKQLAVSCNESLVTIFKIFVRHLQLFIRFSGAYSTSRRLLFNFLAFASSSSFCTFAAHWKWHGSHRSNATTLSCLFAQFGILVSLSSECNPKRLQIFISDTYQPIASVCAALTLLSPTDLHRFLPQLKSTEQGANEPTHKSHRKRNFVIVLKAGDAAHLTMSVRLMAFSTKVERYGVFKHHKTINFLNTSNKPKTNVPKPRSIACNIKWRQMQTNAK